MSDAYYVGLWHRYVQWRGHGRANGRTDAGLSLVEILVAIIVLSVGLLGLAGALVAELKSQKVESTQVAANHLADSWFAYVESQTRPAALPTEGTVGSSTAATTANASFTGITAQPSNPTPVVNGVTYTEVWTPLICPASAIDAANYTLSTSGCSSGGTPGPGDTVFGTFTITWSIASKGHQLSVTRDLADNTTYVPAATQGGASNPIANCTRSGTASGTLSLGGTPAVPPTTGGKNNPTGYVDLDSNNNPKWYTTVSGSTQTQTLISSSTGGNWVTFDLSETGLTNGNGGSPTCIPLTWIDSTSGGGGFHQVDMHLSSGSCTPGGACSYTADVPFNDITGVTASPTWDDEIDFYALFNGKVPPNSSACPAGPNCSTSYSTVYPFWVDSIPTLSNCKAASNGGIAGLLGILTNSVEPNSQSTVFTGSGTNMNSGTAITVTYPLTSGSATFTFLPATNTTAWTLSGTNNVTYTITDPKTGSAGGFPSPGPRNGGTFLGLPVGFTTTWTYSATRNDGKIANCTLNPVSTTVYG